MIKSFPLYLRKHKNARQITTIKVTVLIIILLYEDAYLLRVEYKNTHGKTSLFNVIRIKRDEEG